jgi:hypothetical protein
MKDEIVFCTIQANVFIYGEEKNIQLENAHQEASSNWYVLLSAPLNLFMGCAASYFILHTSE